LGSKNPSKSEVIGRCGGDKKTNDHAALINKIHHIFMKNVVKCVIKRFFILDTRPNTYKQLGVKTLDSLLSDKKSNPKVY